MHRVADAVRGDVPHAQGMVHSPADRNRLRLLHGNPAGADKTARLMRSRAEQLRRQAQFVPDVAGLAFRRRACELELAATVVG